jgi:hypothetical protein
MKRLLRHAVIGAVIFGAVGLLITWAPQYHVAGHDVSWVVGTVQLGVIGAVLGVCFGWLIDRLARLGNR